MYLFNLSSLLFYFIYLILKIFIILHLSHVNNSRVSESRVILAKETIIRTYIHAVIFYYTEADKKYRYILFGVLTPQRIAPTYADV